MSQHVHSPPASTGADGRGRTERGVVLAFITLFAAITAVGAYAVIGDLVGIPLTAVGMACGAFFAVFTAGMKVWDFLDDQRREA